MIDVQIEPLQIYPDDRGFFTELVRLGRVRRRHGARRYLENSGFFYSYLPWNDQSDSLSFRADRSVGASLGNGAGLSSDLRRHSKTFGLVKTLYLGRFRPWEVLVPPGFGHGYKALGVEPIQLLYVTDRHYNPADELRIPYNDPDIAYDWEMKFRQRSCVFLLLDRAECWGLTSSKNGRRMN